MAFEDTDSNYDCLEMVLHMAYKRASGGKGRERHATGQAFNEQPIVTECKALGTTAGNVYQIRKKSLESMRLRPEMAIHELLDVINYSAASVIYLIDLVNSEERSIPF